MKHIFLIVVIFFGSSSWANGQEKQELSLPQAILGFTLMEGIIAANAASAASHPEGYGWVCTLLSPLAFAAGENETQSIIMGTSFLSMAQYNAWELKKPKYSKRERFQKNMVYWHGMAITSWAIEKITGKKINSKKVRVAPKEDGIQVAMSYRF